MNCPACGEQIPDTARFCSACGTRIEQSAQAGAVRRLAALAQTGPVASDVVVAAIALLEQLTAPDQRQLADELNAYRDAHAVRDTLQRRWNEEEDHLNLLRADFQRFAIGGLPGLLDVMEAVDTAARSRLLERAGIAAWLEQQILEDAILGHLLAGVEPHHVAMTALQNRLGRAAVSNAAGVALRSYDAIQDEAREDS